MKKSLSFFTATVTPLAIATGLAHSDAVMEYKAAFKAFLSDSKREEASIKQALTVFVYPVLEAIASLPSDNQTKAADATDRALKRALESAGYPELGFFTMRVKNEYVVCHVDGTKPAKAQKAAYMGALAKAKALFDKANGKAEKPTNTGKTAPVKPDAILPETPAGYTDIQSAISLLEKLLASTDKLNAKDSKALAGLGLTITAKLTPRVKPKTEAQAAHAPQSATA